MQTASPDGEKSLKLPLPNADNKQVCSDAFEVD